MADRDYVINGPVGLTLLRMAGPMVIGMFVVMMYSVVDTFFIGRLGAIPLAAIGFTFPVVFIVTGTTMGMGIGMASVVSRAVGEGDHQRVAETTTRGLIFVLGLVLVFVVCGLLLHDRIFRLLGADDDLLPIIRQYMFPWLLGVPFLVIPMIGNSALRATGDTFTPSLIMIVAGGFNVVLDPFLIFGWWIFPRLELQGAALATVASYLITFVAATWILIRRDRLLVWERPRWKPWLQTWGRLLYIGLPAVMTNLMIPLSNGLLTRFMAAHGPQAVAAFGVASRIESLVMIGAFAMVTIMVPFCGQNFGANRPERVQAGLRFGLKYCMTISLTVWIVLALFSRAIARAFTEDPLIIEILQPFLRWVPLSYGALGFMLLVTASFNGAGLPKHAMWLFGSRLLVFTVPLAWWGSHAAGPTGIFIAILIGNLGAGIFAFRLARYHPRLIHLK